MENHYYTTVRRHIQVNAASCSSYSALELRTNKHSFRARLVPRDFIIHIVVDMLGFIFSLSARHTSFLYTLRVSFSVLVQHIVSCMHIAYCHTVNQRLTCHVEFDTFPPSKLGIRRYFLYPFVSHSLFLFSTLLCACISPQKYQQLASHVEFGVLCVLSLAPLDVCESNSGLAAYIPYK